MANPTLILLVLGYLHLFLHTSEAGRIIHLDARAATPIITAAPTASPTNNLTLSNNLALKLANTPNAAITLKVAQPSRCLQSTIPYSSKFSVPLGNFQIFADNATGWGDIGSVWNFTASDDVQLNFTTNTDMQKRSVFPRCEGSICAAQLSQQAVEPTDEFVHNADGSWSMTLLLDMASSNYVSATASGGDVNNGVFELTVTGSPACAQTVACSPELWNGTVANWADANVDDNFKTWALDLNPNAPTGTLVQGSYPTEMPRIGTGYGTINGVKGVVGQLISIASGGRQVNCQLIVGGENGQCPGPPAIEDACPNMPRWVYLAWLALFNMYNVHYSITGILTADSAYQLGESVEVTNNFAVTDTADATLAIFLSVLGSIASLIGLGIATAGIGAASILEVSAADASKISSRGGILGEGESVPQIPVKPGSQPDIVPNTGSSSSSDDGSSDGGGSNSVDEITEIPSTPLSGGNPPSNDGEGGDATQTVIAKPTGVAPQFSDPGFIGNVGWTAPGTIINLANTIWQQVDKAQTAEEKTLLNQAAVTSYMHNQSLIIENQNDYMMLAEPTDTDGVNTLLNVTAGGSFIEVEWSRVIYEAALSTDVISRSINAIWLGGYNYYVYVSFTNLNDDSNGTICQQTAVGTQSTQYCADGGVYYLAAINNKQDPCLIAPSGWNSILNFGIFPWWPTSGSARAYRALNPNANANPPVITPPNDEAFAQYVDDFVSANTYDMLDLIGQTPGAWTLPTCDQGLNFWTYDYTNKGGLTIDQTIYQPFPCACGFQGSGTAAFYKALGIDSGDLYNVVGSCEEILLNIDPALPKTEANIGWNAINGGKPTQIVYSNEFTLTPPASLPTQLCQLVKGDCLNSPPSADICHGRPSC